MTAYELRISVWSSDLCSSVLFSAPLMTLMTLSARLAVKYALSPQQMGECNEPSGQRVCVRDQQLDHAAASPSRFVGGMAPERDGSARHRRGSGTFSSAGPNRAVRDDGSGLAGGTDRKS